jgi:hypothetical protein
LAIAVEGGHDLQALAGAGEAVSIASDSIVTPRLASHLAHR